MLRSFNAALVAVTFIGLGASARAATTSCATVAACVMGVNSAGGTGAAGSSVTGFGLSGTSRAGHGVNGTSAASFGVVGITTANATSAGTARAGVLGQDGATNKNTLNSGVAGTSAYGIGVTGRGGKYGGSFSAGSGVGLYAQGAAIDGLTTLAAANVGTANLGSTTVVGAGDGLDVTPSGGINPGSGESDDAAIRAYGNSTWSEGDTLFAGVNCSADPDNPTPSCSDSVSIDTFGNAIFGGTVTQNGQPLVRTKTTARTDVAAFAARTATPTIEDFGKAQLRNGAAYVALDRTFATAIDAAAQYMVFLTPEGDSNGLYAAHLGPGGFLVRESKGGRSSLTFDYRIVAKPLDAKAQHLPAMSLYPQLAAHVRVPQAVLRAHRPAERKTF